ncbi:MAG: hypothetical protein JOZ90_11030 [Alphaproteobacteria bacterium]|nr:hypothetical protein [Alphaproteobacteria bacterium]MBV9371008.1 hypothetical protein [Alphaproteobacteria bacterium]MBV9901619.1 hypothetical protein [Alphaproteobacteria bacterium]
MAVLGELLFYSGFRRATLSDALQNNLAHNVQAEVDKLRDSEFAAKSDEELVALMVERCKSTPLELKLDQSQGGADPIRLNVQDVFGDRAMVDGFRITKAIPFDGDAVLFELQPNQFDLSPPRGEVRGDRVIVGMEVRASAAAEAERYINEQVADIQKYIGWQADAIAQHNAALPGAAMMAIQRRRANSDKASEIARRLSGGG